MYMNMCDNQMSVCYTYIYKGPCALFDPTEFQPLDPTQEPIFPAELMVNSIEYTVAS